MNSFSKHGCLQDLKNTKLRKKSDKDYTDEENRVILNGVGDRP